MNALSRLTSKFKRVAGSGLASMLVLLSMASARAVDIRSEKSPRERRIEQAETLKSPWRGSKKVWTVNVLLGVVTDNNITHLLVNSPVDSNLRISDTILRSGAGLTVTPRLSKNVPTEFSYSFDRFDYQQNTLFSYYTHSLSGEVLPKIYSHWRLVTGGDADWAADQNGSLANSQAGHAGLQWSGPHHLRLRTGYEYRHDNVILNSLKNANSNIGFLTAHRRFFEIHNVFGHYRYVAHATTGSDFAFHAHEVRFGAINHWTPIFKTNWIASYTNKTYDNLDSRFLQRRHDITYSGTFKPGVSLLPWLDASVSLTYLENHSNVSIKSYSDQIYSFILEGRF